MSRGEFQLRMGLTRIGQHTQQVQNFLCGTHPAGKNYDAVADANERLQALLDVRQDDEVVDSGIRTVQAAMIFGLQVRPRSLTGNKKSATKNQQLTGRGWLVSC